jgi:dihydropteroate synthase
LLLGVDWINDQSGLADPNMLPLLKRINKPFVMMHHQGIPAQKHQHLPFAIDVVEHVYSYAKNAIHILQQAGIAPQHIIFDVGIGFGKQGFQNNRLLEQIDVFQRLGVKLLVGPSRKSFLDQYGKRLPHDRDLETLALIANYLKNTVDYVRVHNIDICSRFFKIN